MLSPHHVRDCVTLSSAKEHCEFVYEIYISEEQIAPLCYHFGCTCFGSSTTTLAFSMSVEDFARQHMAVLTVLFIIVTQQRHTAGWISNGTEIRIAESGGIHVQASCVLSGEAQRVTLRCDNTAQCFCPGKSV